MKHCHFFGIFTLLVVFSNTLSAQQVRTIWNSKKSNEDRYAAVSKIKNESIPEEFAIAKIKFEAGKNPNIKNSIWKWEALLPSQKNTIEKMFQGITGWYENLASERKIKLFSFTQEITPPISFDELTNAGTIPTTALDQIHYYTLKVQQELFHSENVRIEDFVSMNLKLYRSLNKSDQDSLRAWGYLGLWKEQTDCYQNKQITKTCICGGKLSLLPQLDSCDSKQIELAAPKGLVYDEPTQILSALISGDLSFIKTAKQKQLDIWGNVKNNVMKQLIFLHLAALGETSVPDGSSINLLYLWEKSEKTNSNEYLKQLGFTRESLAIIQSYYACVLSARDISNKKKRGENQQETSPGIIQVTSAEPKPVLRTPYTAFTLAQAVDQNLRLELGNRRSLQGTCLKTQAVNDSMYEVILNGCDTTKQVFPIGKSSVAEIGDFFYYCSNVVANELGSIPSELGTSYSITVTGTADKIPYAANQELAQKRADYIKENLGNNVHATSTQTNTIIDLPIGKRYASLTFILKKVTPGTN